MEGMKTYFDVAENDYQFLLDDYERGKVGSLVNEILFKKEEYIYE